MIILYTKNILAIAWKLPWNCEGNNLVNTKDSKPKFIPTDKTNINCQTWKLPTLNSRCTTTIMTSVSTTFVGEHLPPNETGIRKFAIDPFWRCGCLHCNAYKLNIYREYKNNSVVRYLYMQNHKIRTDKKICTICNFISGFKFWLVLLPRMLVIFSSVYTGTT